MKDLAHEIAATEVPADSVGLWWLAQAGFVFKTATGQVIYLDPYLSDVVEKAFGFKRLSLAPIDAEEVRADWMINSHEHLDHMDTDALPVIARNNPQCQFAGSKACREGYAQCGIPESRQHILEPGATYPLDNGVTLHAVRADHGDLSPDALSLLLDFGQIRVLFTGDTAFNLTWIQPMLDLKPDVLLPCINGRFGNLDAIEAAELTRIAEPRIAIPCHFWMFKEHNGDPESYFQACAQRCPSVTARLLRPGEGIILNPAE